MNKQEQKFISDSLTFAGYLSFDSCELYESIENLITYANKLGYEFVNDFFSEDSGEYGDFYKMDRNAIILLAICLAGREYIDSEDEEERIEERLDFFEKFILKTKSNNLQNEQLELLQIENLDKLIELKKLELELKKL